MEQTLLQQKDTQFLQHNRQYTQQYSKIYYQRYIRLRKSLVKLLPRTVPSVKETVLQVISGELCTIIGTTFKQMPLKPTALKDLSNEHDVLPPHKSFASAADTLFAEDINGRIELSAADDAVHRELVQMTTGIVAAFVGVPNDNGVFLVSQVIHIGAAPQLPVQLAPEDRYVVLLSGLNLSKSDCTPAESQVVMDTVSGAIPSRYSISHVIMAGNNIYTERRSVKVSITTGREYAPTEGVCLEGTRRLDVMCAQLCGSVTVDLMPGSNDPSSYIMPQQPMHKLMFPLARSFNSFHTCTNPHALSIGGVELLGTSGQNIDDMLMYYPDEHLALMAEPELIRLHLAQRTLHYRLLAPTAPDNLGCYPYTDTDPFLITSTPHVYYIGNQPQYGTAVYRHDDVACRVILIPTFNDTHQFVLLNLRTLEPIVISCNTK